MSPYLCPPNTSLFVRNLRTIPGLKICDKLKLLKEGDQEVLPLITTTEDLIVLETVDRLEDHGVAEAIPTMIDSNTEINLFQDPNPIQDHCPSPSPRKK
ncbi:hypothetical protein E2I00_013200 [Balaenoptera physalus]|uniref:Uncharacterized protein n=1 Tax=Balaenoptera physalus TaxID=9770 RepID=A0A643BVC7_BALPH|nr:hypothetical protein E2I00_013200 [Balaenoptera physalus]